MFQMTSRNQSATSVPSPDVELRLHAPQETDHKYELTEIAIPIIGMHVLAMFALIPEFITLPNVMLLAITLLTFSNGITLGYHRLLTHRSLRVPKWIEYSYLSLIHI